MKLWRVTAGVLSCILAVLLVPLCAMAQNAPQYAPWRDYVLIVESAADDPSVINYHNEEKPGARYVMVRVAEMSLPIKMDDIQAGYTDFALRDANRNEYPAETFGVSTIRIVNNELVMDADQESFSLYFDVPKDILLDELTLYVDTAVETEHVTVALAKVPRMSAEAEGSEEAEEESSAPEEEAAKEAAELPASSAGKPALLGQRLASALGEDAYQVTYAFLEEGNVLKNGSNNGAAKGLQMLLRALGATITADGKIGSKSVAAMEEQGGWFVSLGEDGKLSTVDAQVFEDFMLLLLLTKDYDAASALLESEAEAEQILGLYSAAEQALLGNFFSAQQIYQSLSGFRQSDLRAARCEQKFPRNGIVFRNEAYPSKRCDLTIKVGGDDGEATYVKVYTVFEDLVLTAFIRAGERARVSLPADTFIIKTGTGTQWYGEAEAFGEGDDARYSRLYLDTGEDTITLESGYTYTLSLEAGSSEDGDGVSSRQESWTNF